MLVLIALTLAGSHFLGRWGGGQPRPVEDLDWERELKTGIADDVEGASLKIVEFIDFQCPACAHWSTRLDSLRAEYPGEVQVTIHHLPLPSLHEHAEQAAVAVECADRQGLAHDFARLLLSQQILFGVKPWTEFASDVGVEDVEAFAECVSLPTDSFPRIAYGRNLAMRTGVRGTPTIWLNGERRQATLQQMRDLVEALDGR